MPQSKNTVLIKWEDRQTGRFWNDLCTDIMEVFGLPGNKYTTEVTEDCMIFKFNNTKDADLCKILLSENL